LPASVARHAGEMSPKKIEDSGRCDVRRNAPTPGVNGCHGAQVDLPNRIDSCQPREVADTQEPLSGSAPIEEDTFMFIIDIKRLEECAQEVWRRGIDVD
ncbi:MAG: hypothetical protein WBB85_21915, partial [Albidovulum sp.]|uniref:hypothetical protein n=1 Tax=Albidovulum sp. TaxID=1872424 RepID=UPI003C9630D6